MMIENSFTADSLSSWLATNGLVSIAVTVVQVGFVIMAILFSVVIFRRATDGF